MTEKEKNLIANLLDLASEEFSNHGCNDMQEEFVNMFTTKEKETLVKEYCICNNDSEEGILDNYGSFKQAFDSMQDWAWMSFFAWKLRRE